MTWVADPTYGVRAVPIGQAPQAQPQRQSLIVSPQEAGMNVLQFPQRTQSCKIVRQGMDHQGRPVDPWADVLAKIPDMQYQPGVNDHYFKELMPGPDQEAMIQRAVPVNPKVNVSEDPREDAYVGADISSGRVPGLNGG